MEKIIMLKILYVMIGILISLIILRSVFFYRVCAHLREKHNKEYLNFFKNNPNPLTLLWAARSPYIIKMNYQIWFTKKLTLDDYLKKNIIIIRIFQIMLVITLGAVFYIVLALKVALV